MGGLRFSYCSNYVYLLIVFKVILLATLVKADCEEDGDEYHCEYSDFSPGAVAGIILGAAAFIIGISVLLCFVCACLCFSGRKSTKGQVHSVPPPITTTNPNIPTGGMIYYNQQPYNYGGFQPQPVVSTYPNLNNGEIPRSQQFNPTYPPQH